MSTNTTFIHNLPGSIFDGYLTTKVSVELGGEALNTAAESFYAMMDDVIEKEAGDIAQEEKKLIPGTRDKILVIYDNDPDGHSSCAIFITMLCKQHISDRQIGFKPVTHGLPFKEFVDSLHEKTSPGGEYDDVKMFIILDHGVERLNGVIHHPVFSDIYFAVIDHHPGSADFESNELPVHGSTGRKMRMVYHSTEWSTAMLVFKLMYAVHVKYDTGYNGAIQNASMVAALVDYYDTWKFGNNPGDPIELAAKALCGLAFHEGFEDFPWYELIITDGCMQTTLKRGLDLLAAKEKVANKVANKSVNKRNILLSYGGFTAGCKVGVIFHSDDIDNVAAAALAIHDDIDFVAMVYLKPGTDSFKLAFRSRKGSAVDVSKVANLFGGGGHPCSAGAQIDDIAEFFNITQAIES